jgi:Coenzyme PQQ synthesis protein D (PqqD)
VSSLYIARTKEVAARMIGSEMMILSARNSKLFSLNEAAAAIWQAADGATPLSEIVERSVCSEFEVDHAAALRDAEELVEGLVQHGVLRVSAMPIEDAP